MRRPFVNSIIKRCSIATVLVFAALLPDFHLLSTSPKGLALIADLEGCRLTPYQCSAGVWTSGIGHTAGVVPKELISEREAANNLIVDVRNVERGLALCTSGEIPPMIYDTLVSFAFNVGTRAACRSTLMSFIHRQQWKQACDQLSRWVYVNGNRNTGLENRRIRERAYCIKGIP